jgi:hypothetical protein
VGLFKKDVSKEKNLKRKKFSLSAIPRLVWNSSDFSADRAEIRVILNKTTANHYKSGIPLDYQTYPGTEACLGFWIAYVRGIQVLRVNCLRTNPEWMYELRDDIGDLPLTHVCTQVQL